MMAKAAVAFETHRRRIAGLLPSAEIQHIGSTAIPGALSKGDLDIAVRVAKRSFARADMILAENYSRNRASLRDRSFSSFKDDDADPPLGIQLTVRNGPQDHFVAFRDALLADATLVSRYNQLKQRCAGLTMAAYQREKNVFIEQVLGGLCD
jgi:GrpB-like predicted nucleotidyltransferase (UPF0157 family)